MRGQRGWTLIELMVVCTAIVAVSGTVLGVASHVRAEERHSAACAKDLRDVRHAVRHLEQDLREKGRAAQAEWVLLDGVLRRDGRILARNIARFDVAWKGDLATVQVALGPRSDAPGRREASLEFRVLHRGPRVEGKR